MIQLNIDYRPTLNRERPQSLNQSNDIGKKVLQVASRAPKQDKVMQVRY